MFMTFECCDNHGRPIGNKICLNMKTVDSISQVGQWHRRQPELIDDDAIAEWNIDEVPRPRVRPPRGPTRPPTPDIFTLTPGVVSLNSLHNNWTVVADFDKLTVTLESLSHLFEGS